MLGIDPEVELQTEGWSLNGNTTAGFICLKTQSRSWLFKGPVSVDLRWSYSSDTKTYIQKCCTWYLYVGIISSGRRRVRKRAKKPPGSQSNNLIGRIGTVWMYHPMWSEEYFICIFVFVCSLQSAFVLFFLFFLLLCFFVFGKHKKLKPCVQAERSVSVAETYRRRAEVSGGWETQRRPAGNVGNDPNLPHEVYQYVGNTLYSFFAGFLFSEDVTHKHGHMGIFYIIKCSSFTSDLFTSGGSW